jgi:hypothetical protein
VARARARIERAAALHRRAAALAAAVAPVLDAYSPAGAPVDQYAEQHDLAGSLRADAATLAPGWLGAPLDALSTAAPLGGPLLPTFVRVGQAHPLDDARFPVIVPLLRAGHIAIDADARDNRVAALLRSLVLRLLASSPPGSVRIRTVDAAENGGTFVGFTGIEAVMPAPVSDAEGLRQVLDEGERWISQRPGDGAGPTLLIVIASLPELTEGPDLARIAALAHAGPAGRLHLIVAGWPPPPLTAETTQAPLPHATQIALRNPHAWVGDPPGATFNARGLRGNGPMPPSRLNSPVYLDPDPPTELIKAVCAQLRAPWTAPPSLPGEPSRKTWLDYIRAAQRLDYVRRETAAVVADHTSALARARDDLSTVRSKLNAHRARLVGSTDRPLTLAPAWQDAQAAQAALAAPVNTFPRTVYQEASLINTGAIPVLTGPPGPRNLLEKVSATLHAAAADLDASEADLAATEIVPPSKLWMNLVVYGAFALAGAVLELPLLLVVNPRAILGPLLYTLVWGMPLFVFLLAWLTLGALTPRGSGRTPLTGMVISLLTLVPLVAIQVAATLLNA